MVLTRLWTLILVALFLLGLGIVLHASYSVHAQIGDCIDYDGDGLDDYGNDFDEDGFDNCQDFCPIQTNRYNGVDEYGCPLPYASFTPAPTSASESRDIAGPLTMIYDNAGLFVLNNSGISLNLVGVSFASEGERFSTRTWARNSAGLSLENFPDGACLLVYDFAENQPSQPSECLTLFGWVGTSEPDEHFWRSDFIATKNGWRIAECVAADGICISGIVEEDKPGEDENPCSPPILAQPGVNNGDLVRGCPDRWTFQALAGQTLDIRTMSDTDPVMILSGPDGLIVTWDDNGGQIGDAQISYEVATAGTHLLEVVSLEVGVSGPYSLIIRVDGETTTTATGEPELIVPTAEPLQPGDNNGNLGADFVDIWSFDAEDLDRVTLQVSADFDAVIWLSDPFDNLITWNGDSPPERQAGILVWPLARDGTYRVRVTGVNVDEQGSYTLTFELN